MKIFLVFPGQGSQYVGMGKKFDFSPGLLDKFNSIDAILKTNNLVGLSRVGPQEDLTLTQNTQPALVAHSLTCLDFLFETLSKNELNDFNIVGVAGHSVGEYAALSAAGVFSFETAIKLVRARGQFMSEAVPAGVGGMMAALKVGRDDLKKCCDAVTRETGLVVSMANFNSKDQIVVSGHLEALEKLKIKLKETLPATASYRLIPLQVSSPFHCSLMKPAALKMSHVLESENNFFPLKIPYIANVDAHLYDLLNSNINIDQIKNKLVEQIPGCVEWAPTMDKIAELMPDLIVEVGPSKVLQGLIKKGIPNCTKVISMDPDDQTTLESFPLRLKELMK